MAEQQQQQQSQNGQVPTVVVEVDPATEIRCQEKSKGGLSYEVILAEPSGASPPLKRSGSSASKPATSAEEIEEKLKAAEERRLAREAKIQQEWTVKVAKIGEASRKKDEFNSSFINSTKEQLETKMETVVEKREALISDKKEKLKTQLQEIEKTRTQLEKQRDEEREAIEEKLRLAAQKRDESIKQKLDRLKEHDRHVELVRQNKAALDDSMTASSG